MWPILYTRELVCQAVDHPEKVTVIILKVTEKSAFSSLLLKYFLNWQAKQGKRASLNDFADLLGYSRPTISMWLNGTRIPGLGAIEHLASIIGLEVYDALNLTRPNPLLQKLSKIWENIPAEKQQQLAEEAERYEVKHERSKKAPARRKISKN